MSHETAEGGNEDALARLDWEVGQWKAFGDSVRRGIGWVGSGEGWIMLPRTEAL